MSQLVGLDSLKANHLLEQCIMLCSNVLSKFDTTSFLAQLLACPSLESLMFCHFGPVITLHSALRESRRLTSEL